MCLGGRGEITGVCHIVMDNISKSDPVGRNRGGGGDNRKEGERGGEKGGGRYDILCLFTLY